ncbi:MAG: sulfatase-like hydrolase/transferase, partial [Planctomycetota bacterium]|nr:sulfatase-like hydrolase/transferase [Planctomycetota bacterium]
SRVYSVSNGSSCQTLAKIWIFGTLAAAILLLTNPLHRDAIGSFTVFLNHLLLILAEVSVMTCVGFLVARIILIFSQVVAIRFSLLLQVTLLIWVWLQSMVYQWSGHPLFSEEALHILMQLPTTLTEFASPSTLLHAMLSLTAILCVVTGNYYLAKLPIHLPFGHYLAPTFVSIGLLLLILVTSSRYTEQIEGLAMERPTRHPLVVMLRSITGAKRNPAPERLMESTTAPQQLFSSFPRLIEERNRLHRMINVQSVNPEQATSSKKMLVVIVESLRPDLIDPEIMPWLYQQAGHAIFCRNHFSTGNASQHGIFSLINGVNGYWLHQPITFSPLLNRLFKQAGYQVGFFASKNDWGKFYMDGFIHPRSFDAFACDHFEGVGTDRKTLERAIRYLDSPSEDSGQSRLAIAYLYTTHAPYESYLEDRIFTPAADDRLVYPYRRTERARVWNRYLNSAHTVDRLLSKIPLEDKTILIMGDHGESFLEDGTIGHGTQLSHWQTKTPAVFLAPHIQPKLIDELTSHADLLPTLLGISGIEINRPESLDGIDLSTQSGSTIEHRVVAVKDYLSDRVCLFNLPSNQPSKLSGIVFELNLEKGEIQPIGICDRDGAIIKFDSNGDGSDLIKRCLSKLFSTK